MNPKMRNWYKITAAVFILYTIFWGLLGPVPRLNILNETIRNVYYHVPIWFAMLFQMSVSIWFAIRYLSSGDPKHDLASLSAAQVGFFFSIPGLLTGSLWARYTWGTWWTFQDPKLNGVAIGILIYLAYFLLRSSLTDDIKRARVSAVYNIFAYVMLIVFVMILPRLSDSLHPGNGGNPAFGKYDLDNNMRLVFYPACTGWILMSCWIANIRNRLALLNHKIND
ncbi:MAG: cytochrome c biogenesis protein CcsA [Bacteroidia bacterium]